jgi:hypothetical protein
MKLLFFLALVSLSSLAVAADWKKIAETTVCDVKLQILGMEGEKYVLLVKGAEKTKLFSVDGSAFQENALKTTQFAAKGAVSYTFTQPSYVEANPPKIDVAEADQKKRCRMDLAR